MMKRTINKNVIITVFVCGLGFLFGALQNVSAQFIPPGSYQKTCIEIKLDGANLKASCAEKSKSGGIGGSEFSAPVNTALENVYECDGDISNDNGNLKCNRNRNSLLNKQAQTAFTLASMQVFGRFSQGEPTGIEMYAWIYRMFKDYGMAKNFYEGTKQADAEKVYKLWLTQSKAANLRKEIIDRAFYLATGGNPTPTQFAFWDAKIKSGESWYATIHETLKQEMNKNQASRKLMIQTAYVTAFGRMPNDNDLKYWMGRDENFGSLVEKSRNWIYSSGGAADLVFAVKSVLEFNLKRKPNDDEVKNAVSEYTKKRLIFMEMRGVMPKIYY
ncbi:MAG: hypothetical protein K1X72_23695 [Pyrinomonadaceae bacterium]|nr:hypothetical protein [Pyrinomonadaceae bacterium]